MTVEVTSASGKQPYEIQRLYRDRVILLDRNGAKVTLSAKEIRKATSREVETQLEAARQLIQKLPSTPIDSLKEFESQLERGRASLESSRLVYGWLIPGTTPALVEIAGAQKTLQGVLETLHAVSGTLARIEKPLLAGEAPPPNWRKLLEDSAKELSGIPFPAMAQELAARIRASEAKATAAEHRKATETEPSQDTRSSEGEVPTVSAEAPLSATPVSVGGASPSAVATAALSPPTEPRRTERALRERTRQAVWISLGVAGVGISSVFLYFSIRGRKPSPKVEGKPLVRPFTQPTHSPQQSPALSVTESPTRSRFEAAFPEFSPPSLPGEPSPPQTEMEDIALEPPVETVVVAEFADLETVPEETIWEEPSASLEVEPSILGVQPQPLAPPVPPEQPEPPVEEMALPVEEASIFSEPDLSPVVFPLESPEPEEAFAPLFELGVGEELSAAPHPGDPDRLIDSEDLASRLAEGMTIPDVSPTALARLGRYLGLTATTEGGAASWIALLDREAGADETLLIAEIPERETLELTLQGGVLWSAHPLGFRGLARVASDLEERCLVETGLGPRPAGGGWVVTLERLHGLSWSGNRIACRVFEGFGAAVRVASSWEIEMDSEAIVGKPAWFGNQIAVITHPPALLLLDPHTGEKASQIPLAEIERPFGCATGGGGLVCVGLDRRGAWVALGWRPGEDEPGWRARFEANEWARIEPLEEGFLIVSDSEVICLEAEDLSSRWNYPLAGATPGGVAFGHGKVALSVVNSEGGSRVIILGANSGAELWDLDVAAEGFASVSGLAIEGEEVLLWGLNRSGEGLLKLIR